MHWQSLGSWSGVGDRQTESFDVTSGALRLVWEAREDGASRDRRFRVTLHSSISGRPLETLVDAAGAGADTVLAAAGPRVAYLRIESEGVAWRIELEEGARSGGAAR